MTRYIAFLRAINVGGRMVKMADLKKILALPGFRNLATFIQSGNVAFDATGKDKQAIAAQIETVLQNALNFEVKTLLRTVPELQQLINRNPFANHPEDMAVHVTFLSAVPGAEMTAPLLALQTDDQQIRFHDTHIYLLVRKGKYGETLFSNAFLEKKLKCFATTRNWATVNKMAEL